MLFNIYMKKYHKKYSKYKNKYLSRTKNMQSLIYKFNFINKKFTITIKSSHPTNWIRPEGFYPREHNDLNIIKKTKNKIKYTINKSIPKFRDDKTSSYPFLREDYCVFAGQIGLYIPDINHDILLKCKFITNFPLFVSGIGQIKSKHAYITNVSLITRQLYVFTKKYINNKNIFVTYYPKSNFFITPETIALTVSKFITKCNNFFEIKDKLNFVINYIDFKDPHEMGYGGDGAYAGFNYQITANSITKKQIKRIKLYLLHEIYHHFQNLNLAEPYKTGWFNEGFTEFFCRYLSLNKKDFIKETNKFLINYHINPYREAKMNIMTRDNFWSNKFIEKLSYDKGFIYAFYLYQKYPDFIKRYKSIFSTPKDKFSSNDLNKFLKDKNFKKYINNGQMIRLETTGEMMKVKDTLIEFDLDNAIKKKIIKNLKKNHHAYKQGLRNGKIKNIFINVRNRKIEIEQKDKRIKVNIAIGKEITVYLVK